MYFGIESRKEPLKMCLNDLNTCTHTHTHPLHPSGKPLSSLSEQNGSLEAVGWFSLFLAKSFLTCEGAFYRITLW